MRTLLLNLFAGPGTGKSTTAAAVFAELKYRGVNCEMALEYAKDKVWEKSHHILANQIYVFGHQHHRITRLVGQVSVIVSDSPLLHSIIYDSGENPHFAPMVYAEHCKYLNFNVFLGRVKPFNPAGRVHGEEQAKEIDARIRQMLLDWNESFLEIPATPENAHHLVDLVQTRWWGANTTFCGKFVDEAAEKEASKWTKGPSQTSSDT